MERIIYLVEFDDGMTRIWLDLPIRAVVCALSDERKTFPCDLLSDEMTNELLNRISNFNNHARIIHAVAVIGERKTE